MDNLNGLKDDNVSTSNYIEDKHYHLLKRLFVENRNSKFSFFKKHQNNHLFYTCIRALIAGGYLFVMLGLYSLFKYGHHYLISNAPTIGNWQVVTLTLEYLINIFNIIILPLCFILVFKSFYNMAMFPNWNPKLIPLIDSNTNLSYHKFKKKKYSHYLLDMHQHGYIDQYNSMVIANMLMNYHPAYKKDLDVLENLIKNKLLFNINDLCQIIKDKSQSSKKYNTIMELAHFFYFNSSWKIKFNKQKRFFNQLLKTPEIKLSNYYKDIDQYAPITGYDVILAFIGKYHVSSIKIFDIPKYFKEILDENNRKLAELSSKISL